MVTRIGIHLKVKDIDKSYIFYKAFGFTPIFAYGREYWIQKVLTDFPGTPNASEKYEGITFEVNNALFEVANGHIAVKPEVFQQEIHTSKVSATLDTGSVDDIVKICEKNSFEIAVGIKEYPWGTKEVVIRDPDGFILVFREVFYLKK